MKVYLTALGCKLNESELEAWSRQFAARGDEIVRDAHQADLCVVNTCTVTQSAAKKSRGLIKKLGMDNLRAQIVVTGCYATMAPAEARSLPDVALVVSNPDKDQLVALAGERLTDDRYLIAESGCRLPEAASGELASHFTEGERSNVGEMPHPRTRAFVKIEDGCNMTCTFCIIPLARGRAHSRNRDEIVEEVSRLVDDGYRELVLTGVQISDFRLEDRETGKGRLRGLCALVREILAKTKLQRLRLTSIAPWDLDNELLELFSDTRLCRHLHLSLQSGSSTVLRRMRRPYTAEQFADAVDRARTAVPEIAITTDMIVGFPGESEVEFQDSLDLVERIGFARVHVFPYSPRAGTMAAQLPLHVSDQVKDRRAKSMQRVADESGVRFAQRFLGRVLPVLYETETRAPGLYAGYTDNYIRVVTQSENRVANQIRLTLIQEVAQDGVRGVLTSHPA